MATALGPQMWRPHHAWRKGEMGFGSIGDSVIAVKEQIRRWVAKAMR